MHVRSKLRFDIEKCALRNVEVYRPPNKKKLNENLKIELSNGKVLFAALPNLTR